MAHYIAEFKQQVIYPSDKIDSHWKNSMIKLPESVSKSSNGENSEKRSFEDTENDQDRSNIHIEEESEDIYDSVDTFDKVLTFIYIIRTLIITTVTTQKLMRLVMKLMRYQLKNLLTLSRTGIDLQEKLR